MKTKVTERGLLIPRRLLEGIGEVEILREQNVLLIVPVTDGDPILELGTHPISDGVSDASVNHDEYLYRP